jgi:hypothetical protein
MSAAARPRIAATAGRAELVVDLGAELRAPWARSNLTERRLFGIS